MEQEPHLLGFLMSSRKKAPKCSGLPGTESGRFESEKADQMSNSTDLASHIKPLVRWLFDWSYLALGVELLIESKSMIKGVFHPGEVLWNIARILGCLLGEPFKSKGSGQPNKFFLEFFAED